MPVLTVNGIISKENLGITLPHEHILLDISFAIKEPEGEKEKSLYQEKVRPENIFLLKNSPGLFKDNYMLDNEELAVKELLKFAEAGGASLVDQTSIGAGSKRIRIGEIAKRTGLNIILGTGFYIKESLPTEIVNLQEKELIKIMIREITEGVDNSSLRTGIIGELGIGPKIDSWENKLLKSAAKVQKETGLAISLHIQAVPTIADFNGGLNGVEAVKILMNSGADIGKTVVCHADAKTDVKYIRSIIKEGAYVEFDHLGKDFYFADSDFLMDRDFDRIMILKELINDGLTDRILISQDVCLKTDLTAYGGLGYAHILRDLIAMMKNKEISQEAINEITITNPATLLDIKDKFL